MVILKVLAVDDEPGMRSGIERSIERLTIPVPEVGEQVQFQVRLSETAEAALEEIERDPPDILLLDYKLPGMDGLELLGRLNGKVPDLITIMITAYASIETAVVATKKGAYDIMPKPFTPADIKYMLTKAVTRILLTRRARQLEAERRTIRFEFIRVLGHELKAPLNAVSGYLHMFQERTLGTDIEAYDQVVSRSLLRLEQMQKLIIDLLDMTKIESGKRERDLEVIPLRETVENAAALVTPAANEREIQIAVNVADDIQIKGDRGELDMIFNNLISNAVKYNRDGGSVTVSATREQNTATIRVQDTGIGMTPKEMEKLFKEFYRVKNEDTLKILGSGLGLSIVKKLVSMYNGDVKAESEKGVGTVFIVTLNTE